MVLEAMASGQTGGERATSLLTPVSELGLRPAPAPEPLPVITVEAIHLLTWIALVPEG